MAVAEDRAGSHLSGVEAPEVTPMVMGPGRRKPLCTCTEPSDARCSMELSARMRSARSMWYDSTPAAGDGDG